MVYTNPYYDPEWKKIHDHHEVERERLAKERDRLIASGAMNSEACKQASADFDRHHKACLACFKMQHATVQGYAKTGKTTVLDGDQARKLLDSIDTSTLAGLRDRALISVMTFAFARIETVVAMRVEDYFPKGKRWWFRLHEKGSKRHKMPAHHNLEA